MMVERIDVEAMVALASDAYTAELVRILAEHHNAIWYAL